VMPSVDPTTITAPGSSVPGVGPNPSSNPGGVTPPTASNPNQPVVPPVSGPVTLATGQKWNHIVQHELPRPTR
jgi:hypothetical protein